MPTSGQDDDVSQHAYELPAEGDELARLADEAAADPERRAWFHQRPDRLLEALGRS